MLSAWVRLKWTDCSVSIDGRYRGNISGGVYGTSNNSGGGVDSGGAGPSYML